MRAAPLLFALILPAPVLAQRPLPPLSFLGIEAGAPLDSIRSRVTALGGKRLNCQRSRANPEVQRAYLGT